jgi:hypothetical protein
LGILVLVVDDEPDVESHQASGNGRRRPGLLTKPIDFDLLRQEIDDRLQQVG